MSVIKLEVWKRSMDFVVNVYRITKAMPSDERFGLTSQLRRASVSISANLSEGYGRRQHNDRRRFIEIAMGSASEVECLLAIVLRLEFLPEKEVAPLQKEIDEISRMLFGLHASFERSS